MNRRSLAVCLVLTTLVGVAHAEAPSSLKGRFGYGAATRLLGGMASEERLRGVERLTKQGDAQAREQLLELLNRELSRSREPELRLALVRALASFGDDERVGAAFGKVLLAEKDRGALAALARDTAAMALARTELPRAIELLTVVAQNEGPAAEAAKKALAARAPTSAVTTSSGAVPAVAFERLVERARGDADEGRREAILELGRIPHPEALVVLEAMLGDTDRAKEAAEALALSPRKEARTHLERALAKPETRRMAARAGVLRVMARKEVAAGLDQALRALLASEATADRWVGAWGLSALVPEMRNELLRSEDLLVVEAAALALPAHEAAAHLPASTLLAFAKRPFFVKALGHRDSPSLRPYLEAHLTSLEPELRAHAASGLAHSLLPDVAARLARAYAFETEASVRFAIVEALARRNEPQRLSTLRLAAHLDPDAKVRDLARRALEGGRIDEAVADAELRALVGLAFSRPTAKSPAP